MWTFRLLAVMAVSLAVRWYLLDSTYSAVFGISPSDRYLIAISGMAALIGTILFFRSVPKVDIHGGYEVKGLSTWLKDRIFVESGFQITSATEKILQFEDSEMNTGLGLTTEKIDALDDLWRNRIDAIEKQVETASEVMPFLELVFFGLFILCFLLEPSLKFAS